MREKWMTVYLRGKLACRNAWKRLAEEKGSANIVATLLMIVIVIAVAALFREQLTKAVTKVFELLNEFLNS